MGSVMRSAACGWVGLWLSSCAADSAVQESFADGRTLAGEDGALTGSFEIEHPLKNGENPLRVELYDSEDGPVGGAEVSVSPWMPAHGHSSRDEVAMEQDEVGVYAVPSIRFPMAGYWELRVAVDKDGDTLDRFTVPVVVTED